MNQNSPEPNYSSVYRILHWAIAFSFLFLLLTIFLRLTWMNKNHMSGIIQEFLVLQNIQIPEEETIKLAKKIRNHMWDWHVYIGYLLIGLFAVRFILPAFGEMKLRNPFVANARIKERFQWLTYIIFYICVVLSLTTGILIVYGDPSYKDLMEDIHSLGLYYLIPYIMIHLSGIILSEFKDNPGIISRIISGKPK